MFIGYYNPANIVTLLGLASSVTSCFLAISGYYKWAVVVFLLSGVCDIFDGRIARRLNKKEKEKIFGIQIDTVCDIVSFGVTPVIIAYSMGFNSIFNLLIYVFFAICGAIRLSYFNTQVLTETDDLFLKTFTGVPIPFICFVLPPLVLLMIFVEPKIMSHVFKIVYFIVGIMFISKIKIKKIKLGTSMILSLLMLGCVIAIMALGPIKTF